MALAYKYAKLNIPLMTSLISVYTSKYTSRYTSRYISRYVSWTEILVSKNINFEILKVNSYDIYYFLDKHMSKNLRLAKKRQRF